MNVALKSPCSARLNRAPAGWKAAIPDSLVIIKGHSITDLFTISR